MPSRRPGGETGRIAHADLGCDAAAWLRAQIGGFTKE
jgi:hypothetical protein